MKRIITLASLIALLLTACATKPNTSEEPEQVLSNVSAKDCYLCGDGLKDFPYWGQNNVGIISLNTFEIMPVEINRYDDNGVSIMDKAGYMGSRSFQDQENGFYAHVFEFTDSGQASGSVGLNEDAVLDAEKAATFLCQDCLDAVLSDHYHPNTGVGVINFATRELCMFEEHRGGFGLGDYYIDCDWLEPEQRDEYRDIDIQIFFSLRYPTEGSE